MTRPAIVIGLGGTGQWILTYLKKDLLESNQGKWPANVHLLSFDTMLQQEASLAQMGSEDSIRVGDVHLDYGTEFIPLADDVYSLSTKVAQGEYRHIGNWFAADRWIGNLPRASFNLKTGAGQLRQFGRLIVFNFLAPGRSNSVIWRALNKALTTITEQAAGKVVEMFVVGSFAGGTGSGMFIDMGWLARQAAGAQSISLRGYFVLPGAFTSRGDDKPMLARSFAAWRELNRFMTISDKEGLRKLVFNPDDRSLQVEPKTKVYDACYLVDGTRGETDIKENPRHSIFPSIADAISAVLDDKGGSKYTDYVATNLSAKFAEHPGQPLYSTISTFTYKVPVYYLNQEFAHAFSDDFLKTLLGVVQKDGGSPILNPISPESDHRPGFDLAKGLFTQKDQRYGSGDKEEVAYGNSFTQKIAEISEGGGVQNAKLLQDQVNAFLSRAGLERNWVRPFTDFGDDPTATELKKEIKTEVDFTLKGVVEAEPQQTRSGLFGKKETPGEVITRITPQVEREMWHHYGGLLAAGGEYTGTLGEALDKTQAYQLDNYRRLLRIWLLKTLMGDSQTDFVKARGGKLGYAISYVSGLLSIFDDVKTFLKQVQQQVETQKPALKLQDSAGGRKRRMLDEADKKILWWHHPQAFNNITDYLNAIQAVAYSRREAITHRAVEETIELMAAYTVLVKDELERWAKILFYGNDALGIHGLYGEVNTNLNSVRSTHEADRKIENVQKLLLDNVPTVTNDALQNVMRGVHWEAIAGSGSFELKLTIHPEGEPLLAFERPGDKAKQARSMTQKNLGEILGMGLRRYPQQNRLANPVSTLLQTEEPNADDLGDQLFSGYNQTLMKPVTGAGPLMNSIFVRVPKGQDAASVKYFTELEEKLRDLSHTTAKDSSFPIEVVDSADPYKFTMVRTADLWKPEAFQSWETCQAAYEEEIRRHNHDPAQYHAYAPEQNAVRYELRLQGDLRTPYRAFHPRVVHLLEYRDRLEQFFLGWALGYFKRGGDGINEVYWEFQFPGSPYTKRLTEIWRQEPEEAIFLLMNNYIFLGKDLTPGVHDEIDYRAVHKEIQKGRADLGKEGMMDKLRCQLVDPSGLMKTLEGKARIEMGEKKEEIEHPEYKDLRDLGRLIYADELRALGYSLRDVEEGRI